MLGGDKYCIYCGIYISDDRKYCSSSCGTRYRNKEAKEEFIQEYGGKCQCPGGCNVSEPAFLSLDHTFNDGAEHRRQIKRAGHSMYRVIRDEGYPKDRYRLMCFNCNLARAHQGHCPHENTYETYTILPPDNRPQNGQSVYTTYYVDPKNITIIDMTGE